MQPPSARHPNSDKSETGRSLETATSKRDTRFRKEASHGNTSTAPQISHTHFFFHPGPNHAIMGTGWDETRMGVVAEPVGFRLGRVVSFFSEDMGGRERWGGE